LKHYQLTIRIQFLVRWTIVFLLLFVPVEVFAAQPDITSPGFDDSPLKEPVETPDWFKLSFLDIRDDVDEAVANGKDGLIVYFGQKYCPYCKALMEVNFGKEDIVHYTRSHFDVIAIDIRGSRLVTDIDGSILSERKYAARHEARFTPSLVFYDGAGKEVFRLVGYYPVYKFRAALEYVADKHYRKESFRDYLARADSTFIKSEGSLIERDFYEPRPYGLDRSRFQAQRPLLVVFEQPQCHACDVLHSGPFSNPKTLGLLDQFEVVQLGLWADTPVIRPDGTRTTARAWAADLGLFYAPTLIFFDKHGKEIIRVDSVVHFHRLRNVMHYVLDKGYQDYGNFQAWRQGVKAR
jgi:thioredoxin-related protein